MAQPNISPSSHGGPGRLSVFWMAVAGAVAAGALFLMFWSGAPTHGGMMYGQYGAPFVFGMTGAGGLIWSALCAVFFGVALGAVAAVVFNALYRNDRR